LLIHFFSSLEDTHYNFTFEYDNENNNLVQKELKVITFIRVTASYFYLDLVYLDDFFAIRGWKIASIGCNWTPMGLQPKILVTNRVHVTDHSATKVFFDEIYLIEYVFV